MVEEPQVSGVHSQKMAGAAHYEVPRLNVKGAFGVGFADRSLALATLDIEPLAALVHGKIAGRAGKMPCPRFARHRVAWELIREREGAGAQNCRTPLGRYQHDKVGAG